MKEEGFFEILSDPSRVFNADETGFELNPQPKKVLARRGTKNVYNVESSNPKESITVTYNIRASGEMVPPMLTFKDSTSNLLEIALKMNGLW